MSLAGEHVLLRVYLRSADRPPLTPTYELLVKAAREAGLAGATVIKGIHGYGSHGPLRPSGWSVTEHVPVVVEVVDSADRTIRFATGPMVRLMPGGMATLERAHVAVYRHRRRQDADGGIGLPAEVPPLSTLPEIPVRDPMTINKQAILLRVFIGESDRLEGQPLHEAIIRKARELGLAGATVLKGCEGFGANSVIHKAKLLEMSTDLPIVIELVDSEPKIRSLLPHLENMVREGMVTMEHVVVLVYRHNPSDAPPP